MILMVEDELWRNDSYVAELQYTGYTVLCESGVDAAWQRFTEEQDQIEAVILDIMMAPGKRYVNDIGAQGGLRTGLLLFRDMRALHPCLPVIFLTNVRFDLIAAELQDEPKVLVLRKLDYLPHTVPEQLQALLGAEGLGLGRDT